MTSNTPSGSRRGRPRADERDARRQQVLDAASAELAENGVDGVTMAGIARRAGASKETLYSWFGTRDGLIAALIEANADGAAERVAAAMEAAVDPREALIGFGTGLQMLLTSPQSVALNHAAMSSPALAEQLLASGRHRIGPLVESYLASLVEQKAIRPIDPAEGFRLLYGLVIEDRQIRVLLGERAPSASTAAAHAEVAVDRFFALVG